MKRRDFLVHSTLLTATGWLGRSSAATPARPGAAPPAPAKPEFHPLRRNVGYFTARGGSIGWLVDPDALVAVDTQFPDTAQLFLDGLPGRRGRTLDVVINTHHHGDHTGGNGVFQSAARSIVAHANAVVRQRERAERDRTLDRQSYAGTTFPDSWRRDLGRETITVKYHGAAHTDGDVVTLFEKANVIHMGDLVFNRLYPFIDRPGGANIGHWITLLENVHRTYPSDAHYVFGHGHARFGATGTRADLLVFRDFLSGLLDYVQQRITAGEPKATILNVDNLPGFPDYHVPAGPGNRLPLILGVAYDELTSQSG